MRKRFESGFSIGEMLVVLAIIGITVGIAIPLVNEQLRIADVRSAADQLAVHLRAARMIAVAQHRDIVVTVNSDAAGTNPNSISYEKTLGDALLVKMPQQVKIKTSSAATITFHSDGSSDASSTITTECLVSASTERWTLSVNLLGFVSVAHVRV